MEQKLVIAGMPVAGKERIAAVLLEDGKAVEFHLCDPENPSCTGSIFVGHVTRAAANSGGVFVRFGEGMEGYLPKSRMKNIVYRNTKKTPELKAEDELLVMVETDPLKTKLYGLSTELKHSGRYLVVSNGFQGLLFSRKLSEKQKERLAENLKEMAGTFGFIVRTAAGEAQKEEVLREAEALSRQLSDMVRYGISRPQGTCLFRAEPVWMELFRRLRAESIVVTDDAGIFQQLVLERQKNRETESADAADGTIRLYEDPMLRLYRLYSLSSVLQKALEEKIWLRSGASVIIQQTEAFVCIDVNSAKASAGRKNDEAFLEINLEAAAEAARQIRLRQLSGTVLIDFINMKSKEAEKKLLDIMKQLTAGDPSGVNVIDITPLGIMELTRRKRGRSLAEQVER